MAIEEMHTGDADGEQTVTCATIAASMRRLVAEVSVDVAQYDVDPISENASELRRTLSTAIPALLAMSMRVEALESEATKKEGT